ncbi:MAG: sulfite exporter TauE/SafE family protein [Rickettsiales bacterium]|nr:sulfite exporter TauE/SafE family protein [Rickettsiales bacterium]
MLFLLNHCYEAFEQHPSILLSLFLAGLVGGLTHCTGMCGPFVAAQIRCHDRDGVTMHLGRLSASALLPYHFGRMTTYIVLGMAAAMASRQIIGTPLQQWVSLMFLSIAGCVFILSGLPNIKHKLMNVRFKGVSVLGKVIGSMSAPLMHKPSGLRGYGLGVLLGFLPCGLVFAALMIVSTTASPVTAALAMMFFTVGTFPSLFLVGLGSHLAYRKWPDSMQVITRSIMILNGVSLFLIAQNMVL